MKRFYLIAFLPLLLLGCKHKQSKRADKPAYGKKITTNTGTESKDTGKTLLVYSAIHFFSDTINKDIFSIRLSGKNITQGTVIFDIYTHDQKKIYTETFPSSDLLGDMSDGSLNARQQADSIRSAMAHFLDTANFTSPAIDSSAIFDPDENDNKKNWMDVKADHSAVAFTYSHGYEGTYGIAYSKRSKKVVSIFYSD